MTYEIFIPFYGEPSLLRRTVASVLQQTYRDWRLVVIDDDGRHDDLPAWFSDLDDERVMYVQNERNLGANRNFQRCVDLATSERITIMGSDDLMDPEYVETIVRASARYPEAAVIQPAVTVIDDGERPILPLADRIKAAMTRRWATRGELHDGEALAASLLHGDWLYFPSLSWRTDVLRETGFRPGTDVVMDLELVLSILRRGGRLMLEPTPCFRYRRHSRSESSWRALEGSRFEEESRFFAQSARDLAEMGWTTAARAARWHVTSRLHALSLLPSAVHAKRVNTARALLRHAFARPPRELRPAAPDE